MIAPMGGTIERRSMCGRWDIAVGRDKWDVTMLYSCYTGLYRVSQNKISIYSCVNAQEIEVGLHVHIHFIFSCIIYVHHR